MWRAQQNHAASKQQGLDRFTELMQGKRERESMQKYVQVAASEGYGAAAKQAMGDGRLDVAGQFTDLGAKLQSLEPNKREQAERMLQGMGQLGQSLQAIPEAQRGQFMQANAQQLQALGLNVANIDPNDLSDQGVMQMIELGRVAGNARPSAENGFTLSAGQQRFDAQGNPIAQVAAKPEGRKTATDALGRLRYVDTGEVVKGFDDVSRTNPLVQIGAEPKVKFGDVTSLRKDYSAISKDFRAIDSNMRVIETNGQRQDSAGDLALIVAFTKLLDPGSVAREGEVQLTQSAASLFDRAKNIIPKLRDGSTILPPEVRQRYIEAAREMHGAYGQAYDGLTQEYGGIADRWNIDRRDVLVGYEGGEAGRSIQDDAPLSAEDQALLDKYLGGN